MKCGKLDTRSVESLDCMAVARRDDLMFVYLHLDSGDVALLSPVHCVWHINASRALEERWRPLDVGGGSESGKGLKDLLLSLRANRKKTSVRPQSNGP